MTKCTAVAISNGNFNENGVSVTYYCDPAYSMKGSPTLKCNTTGKLKSTTRPYSGTLPVCYLEFFKEPVANGYMNSNGDTVSYYCKTAYTMTGSPSLICVNGTWTGTIPTCTLQFLDSAWFWVLVALLSLALLGCLAWLLCRRWCNCCGYRRHRRVRDPEDYEDEDGCCQGCCQAPGATHEGCCDYYGCCGYAGGCACCCWCCRCCREPIQPETELRIIKSTNPKSKSVLSVRKKKWFNIRRKKKSERQVPKLELSRINDKHIERRNSTGMLPTTRTVRSLVSNDTDKFRRVAKVVPVWMPHRQPIRDINTSTK